MASGVLELQPNDQWGITWTGGVNPLNGQSFDGIAINPSNPLDVAVLSEETNSSTTLWRTLDGGRTFFKVPWRTVATVPWFGSYVLAMNAACSLEYDTAHPDGSVVWITDFFALW